MDEERFRLGADRRQGLGRWRWALAFPLACGILAAILDAVRVLDTTQDWVYNAECQAIVLGPALLSAVAIGLLFSSRPRRAAWAVILAGAMVASAYELLCLTTAYSLAERLDIVGTLPFSVFLPFYLSLLAALQLVYRRPKGAVVTQ